MGSILDRGIKLDSGKKEVRTFARRLFIKLPEGEDAADTVAGLLALQFEQGHGELAGLELAALVGDEFEELAHRGRGRFCPKLKKFSLRQKNRLLFASKFC